MKPSIDDTPFARSLGVTPTGKYWAVRGRSRYTRRVATILTFRTREEAKEAVRELRKDYGDDLSWSNPTGPHFNGGDR